MVFLRNVVNFKWNKRHPPSHTTLADMSLLGQPGEVNGKLLLIKSGECVLYSVLAIYMNCVVTEWNQQFLLVSRGKK